MRLIPLKHWLTRDGTEIFLENTWVEVIEWEEFMNRLNRILTERVNEILKYGRFVDARAYYNYSIHLYSHQCKFIELLVDEVNNEIVWICDAHESDLEKYLSEVDINQLLR